MSEVLVALNIINGLIAAGLNSLESARRVSDIIAKRQQEGRDSWTDAEKLAITQAVSDARTYALKNLTDSPDTP